MEKKLIYDIKSLYRDDFRVTGYEFGSGKKSVCIVGNTRGNEVQQLYVCSQIVKRLKRLEAEGKLREGHRILVHTYGIQFTSFYMPGRFTPHVRMMKAGFENVELAKKFGMPYVVLRSTRPYDTTTLNYNWQVWETHAFSVYTTSTTRIDRESAAMAVRSLLNFMAKEGIVDYHGHDGYLSQVVEDTDMIPVRTQTAGIFEPVAGVGREVVRGQMLARVIDPYEGEVKETLTAPADAVVFFVRDEPLTYASTAVFKLVQAEA